MPKPPSPKQPNSKSKPSPKSLNTFEVVYEIVRTIPSGNVLTYGAISKLLAGRLSAAGVGWALNGLGNTRSSTYNSNNVPWHRVVNSKGGLSTAHETNRLNKSGQPIKLQQTLLEKERVKFREDGTLDLQKYLWKNTRRMTQGN